MSKACFRANWSKELKLFSALVLFSVVLISIIKPVLLVGLLYVIVIISGFFYIKQYRIENESLYIDYLLHSKRYGLPEIVKTEIDSEAMNSSFRALGSGLFSCVGYFYNEKLGWYWSYATQPKNAVVLYFPHKKIVVTPADTESFAKALIAHKH